MYVFPNHTTRGEERKHECKEAEEEVEKLMYNVEMKKNELTLVKTGLRRATSNTTHHTQ